jgi:hypothetical protein
LPRLFEARVGSNPNPRLGLRLESPHSLRQLSGMQAASSTSQVAEAPARTSQIKGGGRWTGTKKMLGWGDQEPENPSVRSVFRKRELGPTYEKLHLDSIRCLREYGAAGIIIDGAGSKDGQKAKKKRVTKKMTSGSLSQLKRQAVGPSIISRLIDGLSPLTL